MLALFSKSEGTRVKVCGHIITLYVRNLHTLLETILNIYTAKKDMTNYVKEKLTAL